MASNVTLVRATGSIAFSNNVSADDSVIVGDQTYVFKASPAQANEVDVGGDAEESIANLAAAINGTGTEGTEYAEGTVPVSGIMATAGAATLTLTAKAPGAQGNGFRLSDPVDDGTVMTVTAFADGEGDLDDFIVGLLTLNQVNSEVQAELKKLTIADD